MSPHIIIAWHQGDYAYYSGVSRQKNPYLMGTDGCYNYWNEGWIHAEKHAWEKSADEQHIKSKMSITII